MREVGFLVLQASSAYFMEGDWSGLLLAERGKKSVSQMVSLL